MRRIVLIGLWWTTLATGATAPPQPSHDRDPTNGGAHVAIELPAEATPFTITLPLDERVARVTLHPHTIRRDDFRFVVQGNDGVRRLVAPPSPRTLRGIGDGGEVVAGARTDAGLCLILRASDGRRFAIEPAGDPDRPALHRVVAITGAASSDATCGMPGSPEPAVAPDPLAPDGAVAGTAPYHGISIADIACDADHEYYLAWGADEVAAMERIEAVIATTNLQYELEVGITHRLAAIVVRTTTNDPYDAADTALICQIADEWREELGFIERDTVQLFSDRDSAVTGVGLASIEGGICAPAPDPCLPGAPTGSYSIVESDFADHGGSCTGDGLGCAADLSAHELGHLWSAQHCPCNDPPTTMNAAILGANTFSSIFAHPLILARRELADCLDLALLIDFPEGRPGVIDPDGNTTVVVALSSDVVTPDPTTLTLHVDDGTTITTVPFAPTGVDSYAAALPPLDCPSVIGWFVTVEILHPDGTGPVVGLPLDAPLRAYRAVVAESFDIAFADDFEQDLGWTVENDPALTGGAWERAVPSPPSGPADPIGDGDGSGHCYLTDNAFGNSDVDGGATRLISPSLDLATPAVADGTAAVLYWRWFSNTGGEIGRAHV